MRQYFQMKEENPDCLLLFRLGDFYEMFGDDALVGSKLMEITLTSRERSKGERMPMCGVPYHALESYLPKLLSSGHRVAICDQVEEASQARGLVRREITRIVTPGTVLEGTILDSSRNNYLASLSKGDGVIGLAFVDMSSGEFLVTEMADEPDLQTLVSELSRRSPRELLASEELKGGRLLESLSDLPVHTTYLPQFAFIPERSEGVLKRTFRIASLESIGLEGRSLGSSAAAVAVDYIEKTQKRSLEFLGRPRYYSLSGTMLLDSSTVRNLELVENIRTRERTGSLLDVLDRTKTPMGRRLIRKWILEPLLSKDEIDRRLDAVEELLDSFRTRTELAGEVDRVRDIERLVTRVVYGNGTPRDLLSLSSSLGSIPAIMGALKEVRSGYLNDISGRLKDFPELRDLVSSAVKEDAPATARDGGIIRPGFNSKLDGLNDAIRESREWISSLEERERRRLGIKSLRVGYNRVFGYYIEISKASTRLAPPEYVRKQTLVNGERYITPELEERERIVLSAEDKIRALEFELFSGLCGEVSKQAEEIRTVSGALAELDVLLSFAEAASINNYRRPKVTSGRSIKITGGRHPMVEQTMPGRYVPNDALLDDDDRRFVILTGPNMAGKSTFMRQTALIVLMAQMGSFVPAESAEIGVVDRVFTRVGAFDDLLRGQSTFMVEMVEVANILNSATGNSLILLDEMGRGTSTFDGMSIAWAVAEHLSDRGRSGAKTIFATHYHQLTDLASLLDGVFNQCMAVEDKGGEILFLRKVVDGRSDRSYGVHVARLAGLPKPVLDRAEEILEKIEDENVLEVRKRIADTGQSRLLDSDDNLRSELKEMNTGDLTPMEAYLKLVELVKKAKGKKDGKN